jgi:hypothetical protein
LGLFRAYAAAGAGDPSYDADVATTKVLHRSLGMTTAGLAHAAYAELNSLAS